MWISDLLGLGLLKRVITLGWVITFVLDHAEGYGGFADKASCLEPVVADLSSREDEDHSVILEPSLEHKEEVVPDLTQTNALDGKREETKTERRSRIQRESRKTAKGKMKQKQFKAKKRREHRPRKRDGRK
ncbi:unnamed protein product [Allacma fusca]|uniref:Uncharacterized protein n=1 Tax=Allacma fusca TaxID=39272 RepID=A0A8J2JND3_9HEXA|nr:unnamed protein product [Allacma fusca]